MRKAFIAKPYVLRKNPYLELFVDVKKEDTGELSVRITALSQEEVNLQLTHADCISNVKSHVNQLKNEFAYVITFEPKYEIEGFVELEISGSSGVATIEWTPLGAIYGFEGDVIFGETKDEAFSKEAKLRAQLAIFTFLFMEDECKITD